MTIAVNVVRWKKRGRPKGTTKLRMLRRRLSDVLKLAEWLVKEIERIEAE